MRSKLSHINVTMSNLGHINVTMRSKQSCFTTANGTLQHEKDVQLQHHSNRQENDNHCHCDLTTSK